MHVAAAHSVVFFAVMRPLAPLSRQSVLMLSVLESVTLAHLAFAQAAVPAAAHSWRPQQPAGVFSSRVVSRAAGVADPSEGT